MPLVDAAPVEGTITRWLRQVGDGFAGDEPLVEVRVNGASVTVPSPAAGVLARIVAAAGEPVETGEPLGVLRGDASSGAGFPRLSSPPAYVPGGEEDVVSLSPFRQAVGAHMVRSLQTAPHLTSVIDVDMTEVAALRAQAGERLREREEIELTFLPFFLAAVAEALERHPDLNAQIVGDRVHRKKYVHLGFSLSGDAGPAVPVVRDANKKSVIALAREVSEITGRAHAGALRPADVRGSTFSVTDPGASGVLLQAPIIHQPQTAILAIGKVFQAPAVVGDQIAVRWITHLCLAADHRVVSGETAARFLQHVKRSLEETRFLFT